MGEEKEEEGTGGSNHFETNKRSKIMCRERKDSSKGS